MDIKVDGKAGKHLAVFVEAISLCNGLLKFPCFVLEIIESRRLDVRGKRGKTCFTNKQTYIENVVLS